jgi:hypothetical protein
VISEADSHHRACVIVLTRLNDLGPVAFQGAGRFLAWPHNRNMPRYVLVRILKHDHDQVASIRFRLRFSGAAHSLPPFTLGIRTAHPLGLSIRQQ